MPSLQDSISPVAVGLRSGQKEFIAVWRLKGSKSISIPAQPFKEARLLYPGNLGIKVVKKKSKMEIELPDEYMAAIVELTK